MNRIDIIISGGRPDVIGTTPVEDKHSIGFKCTYPDDSGRENAEYFEEYSEGKKWFDENKKELGDVQFYASLVHDEEILDEELLDSFWDEETGL